MSGDLPAGIAERIKLLDQVRVVLVNAKFSGNLGMTARVMKNTGFSDLRLISPRAELNKEAYQLAPTGSDILDSARIHDTLFEAIQDCSLVMGTTRRRGSMRRNVLTPEDAAAMVRSAVMVNRVAVVFGSEDSGLSTADLSWCHWIVGMHTGSREESFNLSHAVGIVLYLINRSLLVPDGPSRKQAPARELEAMFADISRFLLETGFIHEKDPKRMVSVVRQILHRSGPGEREVKIIRGILRQARWRIKHPNQAMVPRDTPQGLKRKLKAKPEGDHDD